jgi:hypothetical protein
LADEHLQTHAILQLHGIDTESVVKLSMKKQINAGVPQGSVLRPLLHLLYTADLPTSPESTTATFADGTAVVATDSDPAIASQKLQINLLANPKLVTKWRKKLTDPSRSTSHSPHKEKRAPGPYKQRTTPQEDVKYLGSHLDSRLTWHTHIFAKRKQLGIALTKMYWLLGRKSKLSTSNKLLIYKAIRQPIWTYGTQLWGTASTSTIDFLDRFQSKALRMIVDAPWYVPNTVIRRDLQTPTVKEEIRRYSSMLPHILDNRLTDGGEVVSLTRRPCFNPREDSWYSLLLEAESTQGSAEGRIR